MHLVITDSGLGGLSICAGIARARAHTATRITYVNAWPEPGRGYNDLAGLDARAAAFDRVLRSIAALSPDELVIACNTLSIVYSSTAFSRAPSFNVCGIIDAGVALFGEALAEHPASSVLLLGTRTTIESGVHRQRLIAQGISGRRIAAHACHGLAAAIEQGPHGEATGAMIRDCAARAGALAVPGQPSYVGLCCTHYGFVSDRLCRALADTVGRPMLPLDPNERMISDVLQTMPEPPGGSIEVKVISKVEMATASRDAMASLLEPVSPDTAAALRAYTRVEDLF